MKIVQRHRGWVSDESIRDIGELLGMSPADLDGVATFYNLIFRKPVGRHVVMLCDSVSCWIMGYERIREHLTQRLGIELGETTADDRFTLLPIVCLGACDHAPAMMIDDDLHGDLDPAKIDRHSGAVQVASLWRRPLTKNHPAGGQARRASRAYERAGGYQAIRKVLREMTPQEVSGGSEELESARPRWRRFPDWGEVELSSHGQRCSATQVSGRQCRRDGAGHIQRPLADGRRSAPADRRNDRGGLCDPGRHRLHLSARRIQAGRTSDWHVRLPKPTRARYLGQEHSRFGLQPGNVSSTSARAATCAAKRPGC